MTLSAASFSCLSHHAFLVTRFFHSPYMLGIYPVHAYASGLLPGDLAVKNLPEMQEIAGWIPGQGRPPGEKNGNPLQYSCLGNPTDGGAWWTTAHRFAKNWICLSDQTTTTATTVHMPQSHPFKQLPLRGSWVLPEDDGMSFHLNCALLCIAAVAVQEETKLEARTLRGKAKLGSFRQPRGELD